MIYLWLKPNVFKSWNKTKNGWKAAYSEYRKFGGELIVEGGM